MRIFLFAVLLVACCVTPAGATAPFPGMIELELDGRTVEGRPLSWDTEEVRLLGRGGYLYEFSPGDATNFRKTSNQFRPYSPSQFRAELLRELGKNYEVSGTSHYMVAHPQGQRDKWAQRFEDLYRSFVHYFAVRGFQLDKPAFPLVGIVFHNQGEFSKHAAALGNPVSPGVLGFYSLESNRILVYDMGDRSNGNDWHKTAKVIIHEATHQTAFNTGVHSRYCPPPLWVAEGLATMFEAPGVYDSHNFTRRSDRVNRSRLNDFRDRVVPSHSPEIIKNLVASDWLFRSNPAAAYAEAWALSFYLVETQPRQYTKYLAKTASGPLFTERTSAQRLENFTSVFGDNWKLLESQFLRFMATVE